MAWLPLLGHRPVFTSVALGVFALCSLTSYLLMNGPEPKPNGTASRGGMASPGGADGDRFQPEYAKLISAAGGSEQRAAELSVVTGRVQARGTIASALDEQGVPPAIVNQVAVAMRPSFDFRGAHAGDFFALIRDHDGEVLSFEFQRGRSRIYRVERDESGSLRPTESEVPLERRVVQLGGVIESTVAQAFLDLGEQWRLVQNFADIFVWDVDFSSQSRPGDEFRLVFEKFYDRDGFVSYGKILAAEYRAASQSYVAVYFEDQAGDGGYYTPDGNSVRRPFLRAPVNFTRISSHYSKSRLHPILNVRRPHEGIDYAAPVGTPVWAVADGEVTYMGWSGGFGRLVKIRHNNGYVSFYAHLSRFGKNLKVGQRVGQKRVIGYVGSTGLSTGPHLDYRLKHRGRFVDPLKLDFPKGETIPVKSRERFAETKEQRLAELRDAQPALVLEAAM